MRTRSEKSVAGKVRKRIEKGGPGKLWTYVDFRPLPFLAVAATLSRLVKEGAIRRIRKGVYYSPRSTRFGELSPDVASVAAAVLKNRGVEWKPSGLPAYNGLGLTTQVSPVVTIDVEGHISVDVADKLLPTDGAAPRLRIRPRRIVTGLSDVERATLDALRDLKHIPDSSPAEATDRIKTLFVTGTLSFPRLARLALDDEPPRVRAILGAIGDSVGANGKTLSTLKNSLNPMTTFHLGVSESLPNAREWRIQ